MTVTAAEATCSSFLRSERAIIRPENRRNHSISAYSRRFDVIHTRIKDCVLIDICCGTGAFLIATLSRIRRNIGREKISEEKKQKKYENARKNSLIGVERDASMYSLAYANMRFHGDGKASLFNCSSLVMDSYAPIDDTGCIYTDRGKKYLNEALKAYGQIDIGMINPPYSIDKKKLHTEREYKEVEEIERLENENRKLKKHISALKKKGM